MRAFYLLLPLLLLASCKKSKFGSEWFTMKYDGERRGYLVHEPANLNCDVPAAVIIALHGGVGTPKNIEEQSQLSVLSDAEGFYACYPKGENRTWNGGGCCGKAQKNNRDDVGFISAVIDELLENYNIDPNRVYVTGMSNGGFMAYRLACELPDKIAAIAPVASSMNVEVCNPESPVPVIHFHSYNDSSIPWQGGTGDGLSDHYNPPLDSVLTAWATHNGCALPDTTTHDGTDYDQRDWHSCIDSSVVRLVISHDGGHSWPGGTKPRGTRDEPSAHINAGALMWEFFQHHPKR